jgi:hypothetical protein
MNEVIEPLMRNEPIQEVLIVRRPPAEIFPDPRLARPVVWRARIWSSSLCEADLHCLLQVIEAELIPQLISDYSPARCSPQELSP